jgi:hypothetical protein
LDGLHVPFDICYQLTADRLSLLHHFTTINFRKSPSEF